MKAKIKPLIILIAVFIVALASGIAAGCSIGEKSTKELADEMGLTVPVTYYANGGNFRLNANKVTYAYRTIYYKPGSPVWDMPAYTPSSQYPHSVDREGYVFKGWYWCVLDEEGNPVLKDNSGNDIKYYDNGSADMSKIDGNVTVQLGESEKQFTSVIDRTKGKVFEDENGNAKTIYAETGKHLFLIADWERDVVLEYKLVSDSPITVKDGDGTKTYSNGDVIGFKSFALDPVISLNPADGVSGIESTSHTYISLYYDAECANPVIAGTPEARIAKPVNGESATIYARYLAGTNWEPVRTQDDVKNMFSSTAVNRHYFLVNDVDCTDLTVTAKNARLNTSSIDGNGKTISGFKVNPGSTIAKNTKVSLFGTMDINTEIKNLTIKNIEFETIGIRNSINAAVNVLFSGLETPANENDKVAAFTNFVVDGVKVTVRRVGADSVIDNIPLVGEDYKTDSWLYCNGFTDAEFTAAHQGVTVNNAELIINNVNIVSGGQHE